MIMCPEYCLYFGIDYLLILSFHHNYKYFLLQILKILKHGSAVTAAHSGLRAFCACRAALSGATSHCCHVTMKKMRPILIWGRCWRGSSFLSRHPDWRDRIAL